MSPTAATTAIHIYTLSTCTARRDTTHRYHPHDFWL
jgi:hypothetical protein